MSSGDTHAETSTADPPQHPSAPRHFAHIPVPPAPLHGILSKSGSSARLAGFEGHRSQSHGPLPQATEKGSLSKSGSATNWDSTPRARLSISPDVLVRSKSGEGLLASEDVLVKDGLFTDEESTTVERKGTPDPIPSYPKGRRASNVSYACPPPAPTVEEEENEDISSTEEEENEELEKEEEEEENEEYDEDEYDENMPKRFSQQSGIRRGTMFPMSRSKQSLASSFRSSANSLNSIEGVIVKVNRRIRKNIELFMTSEFFSKAYELISSARFQLGVLSTIHFGILLAVIVIVECYIGIDLPSIHFFNLMHSIIGSLGKASFLFGMLIVKLMSKSYTAFAMVSNSHGVPLSTVGTPGFLLNPESGRSLRWLFLLSIFFLEASLWLLGFEMEWNTNVTFLGNYACSVATYPKPPQFVNGLGNYIQGDTEFAQVYNYGLTLDDGMVGSWAAWPMYAPSDMFSVSGAGVAFAVGVICSPPVLAPSHSEIPGYTQFRIIKSQNWGTIYIADLLIQFPAGSHSVDEWADKDIQQTCQVALSSGEGTVQFQFVADEWQMVTGGQVVDLKIGKTRLTQRMKEPRLFGDIVTDFGESRYRWQNLTGWIGQGVELVFKNNSYTSTQGATFCNIFQWGTLPDGLYHPELTYRGVAAAVGAVGHYVLMQYDGTSTGTCDYYGNAGYGYVGSQNWIRTLTLISVSLCAIVEMAQIAWWLLNCQSGGKYDRAARILENPLRLLYDFRAGARNLLTELESEGVGDLALYRHFRNVNVRFGEDRHTRGEETGRLLLDAPKRVVPISRVRNYD